MLPRNTGTYIYMTGVGFCLGLLLGLLLHLPSVSSPREGRALGAGAGREPVAGARLLLAEQARRPTANHRRRDDDDGHNENSQPDGKFANVVGNGPDRVRLNLLQSNNSERNSMEFAQARIRTGLDEGMRNSRVKAAQSDQLYRKYNILRARDYDILSEGNLRVKQTDGDTPGADAAFVQDQNGIYLVGTDEKGTKYAERDPDSAKNEYMHTVDIIEEVEAVPGPSSPARLEGRRDIVSDSKLPDSLPTLPKTNTGILSQHSPPFDHTDESASDSFNNRPPPNSPDNVGHQNKMAAKLSPPLTGMSDLVSGVYWTPQIEALTPKGFTSEDIARWRQKVGTAVVVRVEEGCGRMQNRRLLFSDGSRACARYRINVDQIQGEIYSFYLSRLLGVDRVPPSVLAVADTLDPRWVAVDQHIAHAQWHPQRPAVLTPWLGGLTPAYIPALLRHDNRSLHPTPQTFVNKTLQEITDLVQWSELIVFDYLTANLDRVVNNMFNKQWNPDMMEAPAHNLERSPQSGGLVFLDNESGLFHSYRLLDKYSKYHESLLSELCIFKRGTADAIKRLHRDRNVGGLLMGLFKKEEHLHNLVPKTPERNIKVLQSRIDDVYRHILKCESRFLR